MLSPNMEDYLEVIYRLSEGAGKARVSDIADVIRVRRPSVSKALRRLTETGYVEHTPYGQVCLTESGAKVARRQVHSHSVVSDFLTKILGLSEDEADREACQIEHTAGPSTVQRMERFIAFVRNSPDDHRQWIEGFTSASIHREDDAIGKGEYDEGERAWTSPV